MTTADTRAALDAATLALIEAAAEEGKAWGLHSLPTGDDSTYADYSRANEARANAEDDIKAAITAHVEAEVTRRLAVAPGVEEAIYEFGERAADHDYRMSKRSGADRATAEATLRASIAADFEALDRASRAAPLRFIVDSVLWAVGQCHDGSDLWSHMRRDPDAFRRAVERVLSGKIHNSPTPDEARRLVDALSDAAYDAGVAVERRAGDGWRESVEKKRDDARTALLRALGADLGTPHD